MISERLAVAIARAVERAGGDWSDVEDLIAVWERLERDHQARIDYMRHRAEMVCCSCSNGGAEPAVDGRCSRCWGWLL